LVVASVAAAAEGVDPLLPGALTQTLRRPPPGGEEFAGGGECDIGADPSRQQQCEDEQLPQRRRLVAQSDRGLGGEGATMLVDEATARSRCVLMEPIVGAATETASRPPCRVT